MIVKYQFKNISKEPVSSFSFPDIKLFDPNDVKYDEASGAEIAYKTQAKISSKSLSDLNPGITSKEATVFEVAKENWKGLFI